MTEQVFVVAIWSHAPRGWAEFAVSSDAEKVRQVQALLVQYTANHVRILRVERDDWAVIGPALGRLAAPPRSYTLKEFEMFCDLRRAEADALLSAFDPSAEFVVSGEVVPFEALLEPIDRRPRGARRIA